MKKVLAITGIRSDYDLLSSLYLLMRDDPDFDLRLIVGGAHLSRTFGYSVELIKKDGLKILHQIESLIDGDRPSSRLKSASIFLQAAIDPVAEWNPDLIIYAGDREEVLVGGMLGVYLEIPTVHFYAGDHTLSGHVDNPVRHATSKLSSIHCVATEEHRERLISIGEERDRIFVTGNLALDNFVRAPVQPLEMILQRLGCLVSSRAHAVVIFHPDPSEKEQAGEIMESILQALAQAGIFAFVGYPNSDPANRSIIEVIEKHSAGPNLFAYRNLARDDFIAIYKSAALIIGNSSSGIIEAASIPIPAINVGNRQRGRVAPDNVIFCDASQASIANALDQARSSGFKASLAGLKNPYGDGKSAVRALKILRRGDFSGRLHKIIDPLKEGMNDHAAIS